MDVPDAAWVLLAAGCELDTCNDEVFFEPVVFTLNRDGNSFKSWNSGASWVNTAASLLSATSDVDVSSTAVSGLFDFFFFLFFLFCFIAFNWELLAAAAAALIPPRSAGLSLPVKSAMCTEASLCGRGVCDLDLLLLSAADDWLCLPGILSFALLPSLHLSEDTYCDLPLSRVADLDADLLARAGTMVMDSNSTAWFTDVFLAVDKLFDSFDWLLWLPLAVGAGANCWQVLPEVSTAAHDLTNGGMLVSTDFCCTAESEDTVSNNWLASELCSLLPNTLGPDNSHFASSVLQVCRTVSDAISALENPLLEDLLCWTGFLPEFLLAVWLLSNSDGLTATTEWRCEASAKDANSELGCSDKVSLENCSPKSTMQFIQYWKLHYCNSTALYICTVLLQLHVHVTWKHMKHLTTRKQSKPAHLHQGNVVC